MHTNVKKTLRDLKSLSETQIDEQQICKKSNTDTSRLEVKQEPAPRLESDQHHKRYSRRYQESSRRMEDEEWRPRRMEHEDRRKGYSRRMEDEGRRTKSFEDRSRLIPNRCKTSTQVKKIYNVSYIPTGDIVVNKDKDDLREHINIFVYQEGNADVDPYHAVVDTGCSKTVCGRTFMDAFIASKGKNFQVERKYEDQNFKFGE